MTPEELFNYLQQNYTRNGLIQYRMSDIENEFSGKELQALTLLHDMYQPGMGTVNLPAVIHPEDKDKVVEYLKSWL